MGEQAARFGSEQKRIFEVVAIIVTTAVLIGLSRLEMRLFDLSEMLGKNRDFVNTVVYFGLINFNVILILALSFLLFRNVAKLVVERRRGVFGSRLRAKLVATLVFFALAPTVLLFYVSSQFIITSFDQWFSEKVRATMHETREAGARVYKQDQRRLEGLAHIALQRIRIHRVDSRLSGLGAFVSPGQIDGFDSQYGIDNVMIFDRQALPVWSSRKRGSITSTADRGAQIDDFIRGALARFAREPGLYSISSVAGEDQEDVVRGVAPIRVPATQELIGLVVTETRFETQILKSIETIQKNFANLRPSAQLIKLSYHVLLIVMALLIVFSAVWLGFYVARGITGPLQSLAEGTREIALGNYDIGLLPRADDETGQLVRAFNLMTKDLQRHRSVAEQSRSALLKSNEELERRRKYMEVVLQNITAGVIAVDQNGTVSTFNLAAEKLLKLSANQVIGRLVNDALGANLLAGFWRPLEERLLGHGLFSAQIDLTIENRTLTLLVDGSRLIGEDDEDLGFVVVFDDAAEQLKLQRVVAWREVARRIAHEIKNPITPIKLSAQRLLRKFHNRFADDEREVFESCLETILKQVDSLRDLVNEFSKFSRLPAIEPKISDINAVIEAVCDFFRSSYPTVTFDTALLGPVPQFFIDKEQMNRAFVNLVTNAVEALPADDRRGLIQFRSEYLRVLDTVRIEIIDNGCGIPANLRERVLEPYYSTKDTGTGLGLAIVNQIITDHGGYLRIEANEPAGTKMIIELPVGSQVPHRRLR